MKRSRSSKPRAPTAATASPPESIRRPAVAAIFLGALVLRLLHLWQIREAPYFDVLMGDAKAYDEWAQRLAGGDWIGQDVFYQAPLYPYVLGLIYSVFGRDLFVVRVCQALIGAASCAMLGAAGARMFGPVVGIVAGTLMALYPPAIFFDGLMQKSVLDVFFISAALWLVARLMDTPRQSREWLYLGLVMGGLSLTRENALVFVLVVMAWLAWGAPIPRASRPRAAATFALGLALVLAPVALRNYAVGGGFYLTTAQLGPNFYIGNNPGADGTYMSLRYGRGSPEYERTDATELAERAEGRTLSPSEVSRYWMGRAMAFITSQPGSWLALMARKFALTWNADEMLDTESQESYAEWSTVLKLGGPIGHFGVLVPLAVLGVMTTWPQRRRVWVVYAMVAAYAASVVAFYVFARYRFPLVPLLILLAAAGLAHARHQVTGWSRASLALAGAVMAVMVLSTNWPLLSSARMRAITETNLGAELQDRGALEQAAVHYRRAIAIEPAHAPAHNNLGTVLRSTGDYPGAVASYERALALVPDYPTVHFNLANALLAAGKPAEALPHFESALETNPSVEVVSNFGIALEAQGRGAEAVAQFRRALAMAPQEPMSYRNLANALVRQGETDEALSLLRKAVSVAPSNAEAHYDLAGLLLERRQLDEAIATLRTTLTLRPNWAEVHNNLGIALGSQGKLDEAVSSFRTALSLDPNLDDAKNNLAMVEQLRQARGPRR